MSEHDPSSPAASDPTQQPGITENETPENAPVRLTETGESPEEPSVFARYFSFFMLLGVIILVSFLFYEVMVGFFVPLFLALILVVIFRPLFIWILPRCKDRKNVAALATTAAVLLMVLVPLGILVALAVIEGQQVAQQFNVSQVTQGVVRIRSTLQLEVPPEFNAIDQELDSLNENIALNIETEDYHRTALFEAESSAKSLAVNNELEWPEALAESMKSPDETDEFWAPVQDENSSWNQFASNLVKLRALHRNMDWDPKSNAEENQRQLTSFHDYQRLLNSATRGFDEFKTQKLGGRTKVWLANLLNPTPEQMDRYTDSIATFAKDQLFAIGGQSIAFAGKLAISLAIMILAFYFFLLDGPGMLETFKGLSPIDDDHEQELAEEFARVSRAVVVATLLAALVQGLLAGIGFYFAGLESIILLTVLSGVLAMVPFVGAASVWIPCSLYLYFVENQTVAAIGLAIYGFAVISTADNIIKPMVLHGQSNLHPLLAFLSVIGGVGALGPIGILIGPMVVAFLQTLLKILRQEMMEMSQMIEEGS